MQPCANIGVAPYYEDRQVCIFHGRCEDFIDRLGLFDLLLTDPPYGHGKKWQGGTWAADPMYDDCFEWDAALPSYDLMEALVARAKNSVVWGGNYFPLPPSRCWLAWDKKQKMSTLADFELAWTNLDRPSKIFLEDRHPDGKREHPTQKPLSLMKWCILQFPKAGTVLDPFMGSGTTLRAAKDLGLKAVGIDISEKYCEVAARKMAQEVLPFWR